MPIFEKIQADNYEQVVFCNDARVGLKAIIAIHNSALGPATGGCRMWNYKSEDEALTDVLRLSKGMTYKASISNLALGGGKSIIIGDASQKTPELLKRYADFVESLRGTYITAKDVGVGAADLQLIKTRTSHILGVPGEENSSGDPSPVTAWGVYNGILAAAEKAFGKKSLSGVSIALQGLGTVNYYLLSYLKKEGAKITGCDINADAIARAQKEFDIEIVSPESIYDVKADIFSPGALGAIVNEQTLPRLKCKVIAGAANNQLATEDLGEVVLKKGMLYAPDYAINAGGLINIYHEKGGYDRDKAYAHVAGIYDTIKQVLDVSEAERIPANLVANKIAEDRVKKAERARA